MKNPAASNQQQVDRLLGRRCEINRQRRRDVHECRNIALV